MFLLLLLALKALKERKVLRGQLERKVQRAVRERLVLKGISVHRAVLVHKERLAVKVLRVHKDLKGISDHKVI